MADLATYMTITNNTPYSLGFIAKSDSHGYWDVPPPSSVSAFNSSDVYVLKDHSGAASGSEGTTEYQIVASDISVTASFVMRFCNSYSANNNYCYFSNSHPETFATHFLAKIDDGAWHNNYCPESGHPVHLHFFITALSNSI